ncbi:uncharacterized protein LOC126855343 isoform X5 [Cataglyphis hispanica]|uniref:uncharacterized protein LOC126855343 isoform X5 n=1 Tax=Cataglyphis hispanica TaxID=1086592 RepID=UPI00217F82EC|nr:uncharacterized protein LOC126855343 isoform X5 [Cataglyphis hispanica]
MRISGMPSEISGEYRFANFVLRDRRRSSSRILDLPLEHHGRLDKLYKFSIYFLVRHKASRKTQQDSDMSYRFLSAEIARISGVPSEISGEYRLASEWTCVCVCMCVSTKDGKDQITTISAVERKMVWTTNFRQTRDLIYLARSNARKAQILCEEKVATRETKMSVVSIVAWLLGAVALAAINNATITRYGIVKPHLRGYDAAYLRCQWMRNRTELCIPIYSLRDPITRVTINTAAVTARLRRRMVL